MSPRGRSRTSLLGDGDKADRFVQAACRVVLAHAETQLPVPVGGVHSDELEEQPTADPLAPPRGDDGIDSSGTSSATKPWPSPCRSGTTLRRPVHRVQRSNRGRRTVAIQRGRRRSGDRQPPRRRRGRLVGAPDRSLAENLREERHINSTGGAVPNVLRALSPSSPSTTPPDCPARCPETTPSFP
jgi:hypothetical protein